MFPSFGIYVFDPDKQTISLNNIFTKRKNCPIPFIVDIVKITQIITHELSFRIILNFTIKKLFKQAVLKIVRVQIIISLRQKIFN